MKASIHRGPNGEVFISIPAGVLHTLGWTENDSLILDIPMVHGGMLCVEKKA